ncbi:M23 family metallopeptidase [Pseudoflavitalea sp. X16]|uniref:M23 family metallopeptidase n=1 Tax=Paraflavitalea devenefica TaxID=2716334 RepID=UPI0014214CDD|nr:M23 family metallopeptidase [Paraflavitalea devenefica]NII28107.1 M23 family metallopeptidase [Paraflavitalea devenefica]
MKLFISSIFLLSSLPCLAQLSDREVMDLKSGRRKDDTSYVYWLPYEESKSFLLIQASNSKMSHKEELSLDFKMKKGSKICAAREGIVTQARGDSDKGGLKEENLADGNYIIIRHYDGSVAKYWHLEKEGVYVQVGDTVQKGQLIGASGNTGYTAFPHLHFQINDASGRQILTRFYTRRGILYLRPGNWYRCVHD